MAALAWPFGALAIGAVWGFAGTVFFPAHADEQQVFLAFLLAGVVTGGIPVFSGSWPIFALFAASILLPFAYVLATFGNRLFTELAALLPVFYAVNVAHRVSPEQRVRQRLPAALRLQRADRRLPGSQRTSRRSAARTAGGEPAGRGVRAQAGAVRRSRADRRARDRRRWPHPADQPRGGASVRLRASRADGSSRSTGWSRRSFRRRFGNSGRRSSRIAVRCWRNSSATSAATASRSAASGR